MSSPDYTSIAHLPGPTDIKTPVQAQYQMPEPERVGRVDKAYPAHIYEPLDTYTHPNATLMGEMQKPVNTRDGAHSGGHNGHPSSGHSDHGHAYNAQYPQHRHELPQKGVVHTPPSALDPAVVAGYIPPPPSHLAAEGYADEHQYRHMMNANRDIANYNARKTRNSRLSGLQDVLQLPVLLALLFFVFNSDRVNLFLVRTFASFGVVDEMGAYTFSGMVFKSALFGAAYWASTQAIDMLSEI